MGTEAAYNSRLEVVCVRTLLADYNLVAPILDPASGATFGASHDQAL